MFYTEKRDFFLATMQVNPKGKIFGATNSPAKS